MTSVAMRSHLVDPDRVVLHLLVVAVVVLVEKEEEEVVVVVVAVIFGDDFWSRKVECGLGVQRRAPRTQLG